MGEPDPKNDISIEEKDTILSKIAKMTTSSSQRVIYLFF